MRGAEAVRVVAAALAAIAFVSGSGNLTRLPDPEHHETVVSRRVQDHRYEAPVPPLRFVATVTSLNPAERRVQVSLRAVSVAWPSLPVFVDGSGKPVVLNGVLRPEFAEAKLDVVVSNSLFEETIVPYPLAHLVDSFGSHDSRQVSASVPARFDPSQFPNDTYALDLRVVVRLPSGLAVAARDESSDPSEIPLGGRWPVPVLFGIALDDNLGQWTVDTDRAVAGGPDTGPYYNARIKAEFGRGWTYWAFVYAVSLMPAVIGLGFFVRTRRRSGAADTSAAMELAAALLALIALRQVFVPTDIVALTRLDFLLGVQLLAVCWLMAVTYVAEPQPPTPTPPAAKPRARRRRMAPRLPDGAIRRR